MANTFKLKTHAGMSATADTLETLYTCGASSGTIVLGLLLCNMHTSQISISVQISSDTSDTESNADVYILNNYKLDAGNTQELLTGGKIVLQNTDILKLKCDVAGKVDASLSILEMT